MVCGYKNYLRSVGTQVVSKDKALKIICLFTYSVASRTRDCAIPALTELLAQNKKPGA